MKENESRTLILTQTLHLHRRITQYNTIFPMLPGQIALKGPHLAKTSGKSLWSLYYGLGTSTQETAVFDSQPPQLNPN